MSGGENGVDAAISASIIHDNYFKSDTLKTLCIDTFGQDGFPRRELAEGTNASYMATGYRGGERGMEEGGVVLNHVICTINK